MASITNETSILLSSLYKNKYDINSLISRFTDICEEYKKARPEVLLNYERKIPELWYKKADQFLRILKKTKNTKSLLWLIFLLNHK